MAHCSSQHKWKFLEEQAFTGYDNDANMVKIAILNLYLHWLERAHIEMRNALTTGDGGVYPGKRYDVILANPPFSGRVQEESLLSDLNYKLNTRATELLFLKWFIDHLTLARLDNQKSERVSIFFSSMCEASCSSYCAVIPSVKKDTTFSIPFSIAFKTSSGSRTR